MKPLILTLLTLLGAAFAQEIRIDGSSTVYPVSLAVAEEYQILNPDARVIVAFSGTGGGFKKFCAGETDVSDASRPIKQSEIEACAEAGIDFIELPVAADALTVVVNPENDWASCVTTDELHQIWRPGSSVTTWRDVRPEWPEREIVLYGAGTDSGTFDYFTEAVNGDVGAIRTDFFPSEDDNVLVQGVEGNVDAMGFFGYAYYVEAQGRLKALEVDAGNGCVAPSPEAIETNTYTPLSRPLFIYVNAERLDTNPALAEFVAFYLSEDARPLIADTGYATYAPETYEAVAERLANRVTGSSFVDFEPGDSVIDAVREAEGQ